MGAAHRIDTTPKRSGGGTGGVLHTAALGNEEVVRPRRERPRGERPPDGRVVTGAVGYCDDDVVEVDAAAEAAEIKRQIEARMKRNSEARRSHKGSGSGAGSGVVEGGVAETKVDDGDDDYSSNEED